MPLHYKTRDAAVKKYGHLNGDTLRAALESDVTNYTAEEIELIIEFIEKGGDGVTSSSPNADDKPARPAPAPAPPKPAVKTTPSSPNAELADQLKEFDYSNLVGQSFKRYCLLVQTLQLDKAYDFELYQVEVVKRVRYRGVKDSPVDTVGFKLRNSRPLNTTRIPVKHALDINGRVEVFKDADGSELSEFETIGCQLDHNGINGRYYLLKKVS